MRTSSGLARRRLWELLAVALVAAAVFVRSSVELDLARERGVVPSFYQGYYEPAMRVACGQSFGVDRAKELPREMDAFLKLERDSLSCDLVPPAGDLDVNPPTRVWYHLMITTGALWKVTGISWQAVDGLAAGLLSLAAIFVYGLFRLWMPIPIALAFSLLSIGPGLRFLPFLRDLNKAPFILASFFVAALLLSRNLTRRGFFAAMTGIGLWLGIGYGFRPDVLIGFPLLVVTAIFFRPAPLSRIWQDGVIGTVMLLAAFLVAASPAFPASSTTKGGCHWHFALLGLSDVHNQPLGLQPSSVSWYSHYDDLLVWRSVESYAERVLALPEVGYCTPMYDQVSRSIYLEIIHTFPGDFLSRGLSAARQIIGYGLWGLPDPNSRVGGFMISRRSWIGWAVAWMAAILVLLAHDVRRGLFACFALAYLCAYPLVQFQERHYFHLAFLAWVPLGLALALLVRQRVALQAAVRARSLGLWRASLNLPPPAAWGRAMAIAVGLAATAAAVSFGARRYQEVAAAVLLGQYLHAPGEAASEAAVSETDGKRRITYGGFALAGERNVAGRALRLEFGGAACAMGSHTLTVGVSGPDPNYEFKKDYAVPLAPGKPRAVLFLPLYYQRSRITEAWVELPRADGTCLVRAEWVDPKALPSLWVSATLYPGA